MSARSHRSGRAAEGAAAQALAAAGYTVVESNWRTRGAEIDHVCRDDLGFVFVEVRARGPDGPEPSATIGRDKAGHLLRGGRAWLAAHGRADADWRCVVVAVDLDADGRPVATTILEDPFRHLPEYHDGRL